MRGFALRERTRIDDRISFLGRGFIRGALFDLGPSPAAVAVGHGRVAGELYEMDRPEELLAVLDEVEGYAPLDPTRSAYVRTLTTATLDDGSRHSAWTYLYNASLVGAVRIGSGDYRAYLTAREAERGRDPSSGV
jgi:gamma-glutamylcyclotransferase (GGCT)/AIG2-like uncharacterized protein YtfP